MGTASRCVLDGMAMSVPLLRFAFGVFFFGSGCLLSYRAELGRNRIEFAGGLLILLGLILGFWGSLWS